MAFATTIICSIPQAQRTLVTDGQACVAPRVVRAETGRHASPTSTCRRQGGEDGGEASHVELRRLEYTVVRVPGVHMYAGTCTMQDLIVLGHLHRITAVYWLHMHSSLIPVVVSIVV